MLKPFVKIAIAASMLMAQLGFAADSLKIYAAASLTNAIGDIAKQFEQANPDISITPVFGASSMLAKQIEAGAPAQLYFSADEQWMRYLIDKNKINANQSIALLSNQLVLIAPKGRSFKFKPLASFNFANSFKGHLCAGQLDSVPAGIYAKQSLIKLGWLDSLNKRIVETNDVRGALAFVERGECAAGIVYATDAKISSKVRVVGVFPEDSHQPIVYPLALTIEGQTNPNAQKFLRYITTNPQAKKTFRHYGFTIKP